MRLDTVVDYDDRLVVLVPDEERHVDRDLSRVYCGKFQREFVLLWDTELCPFCGREV